jgi:hypothetical protein
MGIRILRRRSKGQTQAQQQQHQRAGSEYDIHSQLYRPTEVEASSHYQKYALHFSGSIQLAMDIIFRASTLVLLLLRLSLVIRMVREPAYQQYSASRQGSMSFAPPPQDPNAHLYDQHAYGGAQAQAPAQYHSGAVD